MIFDFDERLHAYVENLDIQFPIRIGLLDREDSVSLYANSGGKTIRKYMDGTEDKKLNYEFSIKTKNQAQAINTLNIIARKLEEANDIPSKNGSYEFLGIEVTSESFFVGQDELGFFFYRLAIQAELTINKEE